MLAKYDAVNAPALRRLVAGGAVLKAFPVPVMEAAYKAAHEMYEQIAATNPNFKKALDSMTAFRSDQYQWWQVGEFSFDAFMIRMRNRA
jgi:TRAP-type mannitol/chloroaromatic compound transport system substrate-binding protein